MLRDSKEHRTKSEREKSVVLWFQFSDSSLNKERKRSLGAPGREAFTLAQQASEGITDELS